jgi:hypothetical protein
VLLDFDHALRSNDVNEMDFQNVWLSMLKKQMPVTTNGDQSSQR